MPIIALFMQRSTIRARRPLNGWEQRVETCQSRRLRSENREPFMGRNFEFQVRARQQAGSQRGLATIRTYPQFPSPSSYILIGPRQIFSTAHVRSRQTALPRPCGGAGERVDQQRRGNGCSVRQRHRTCNFDRRDLGATGYSTSIRRRAEGQAQPNLDRQPETKTPTSIPRSKIPSGGGGTASD